MISALISVASIGAQAATCQVPLRNVLVPQQDCGYYETAFRMMANSRVSVQSFCEKGSFTGSNGKKYGAQVLTTLTVHDTSCKKMKPVALNPVLLSKPNCENLKNSFSMLATDYVNVVPVCKFGSWVGSDGSPRTSMVTTRLSLRSRMAQR
jgi:hypothetical protein